MMNVRAAEPPASRQRIGIVLYAENVARAADRMEEPGLSIGFKLPSQVGHEHLNGVCHRKRIVAPDLVQQALSGDDDPLVTHQVLQELELPLRQVDLAVAPTPRGCRDSDADRPRSAPPAPRGGPAAQQRPEPSQQLLALERLDQVIVGAGVEALHAGLDRVARGQDQDRHVISDWRSRLATSMPSSRGRPRSRMIRSGRKAWASSSAAGHRRRLDLVSLHPQRPLEDLGDGLVVLDDQDAGGALEIGHYGPRS